jgi:hypothetical protein
MNTRQTFITSSLASLILATPALTLADTTTATASPTASATTLADAHLAAIQKKGDTDITTRLNSLNTLVSKINGAKKLSSTQKSDLTAEIQAEITSLTTLKTSLDGETTVEAAKTDFQNIFAQHYIFAFYIPRVERILAADRELDAATALTSISSKLQGYITQAKTAGNDVTQMQSQLTEMNTKTADAQTQAQAVIDSLISLKASGYPGNKTTIENAVSPLKTGRSDLEAARKDAKSIVTSLRSLLKGTVQ